MDFVGIYLVSVFCYRWKGENVATSEVADILTVADCIFEANVYGVNVEGKNITDAVADPQKTLIETCQGNK